MLWSSVLALKVGIVMLKTYEHRTAYENSTQAQRSKRCSRKPRVRVSNSVPQEGGTRSDSITGGRVVREAE